MASGGPITWLARVNLARNPRRTVLTLLPTVLGLAALLLLWSLDEALRTNLVTNFQRALVGTIQVHRQGFFRQPRISNDLADAREVIAAVEEVGVEAWAPRLESFMLAVGPGGTTGLMLIAIDPVREPTVTDIHHKVDAGGFFAPDAGHQVLLGETSARNLDVRPGDTIDLIANDRFGAPVGDTFEVAGIIVGGGFGVEADIVFTPLTAAQELLEMKGRVTTVVMRVPGDERDAVAATLTSRLDPKRFEVMRWNDMFPVMEEWVKVQALFEYFFLGVVLILVAAAVGNVALVASLGRRREFRVMLAIGQPRRGLRRLLLLESLWYGLLGCAGGLALGILLVAVLAVTGVDMGAVVGGDTERYFVDPVLYPRLDAAPVLVITALVLAANLLAGLVPAWSAGTLRPLEGSRGI